MRKQPKRNWVEAREKVEREGRCRVCGRSEGAYRIEAAHVVGRFKDKESGYRVLEDRVVPLCPLCHGAFDRHEFDVLPHLTLAEQTQAVIDCDGIALAMKRTAPVAYKRMNEAV